MKDFRYEKFSDKASVVGKASGRDHALVGASNPGEGNCSPPYRAYCLMYYDLVIVSASWDPCHISGHNSIAKISALMKAENRK